MPVSLQKGQKVSLTKDNPGLKKVVVGLGWDVNAFDTGGDFDLDAAAFLLNDTGKVSGSDDFVFYGNLSHPSGSVVHQGDNLTGIGDGDDEQIKIDLSKVPENVTKIAFTVTIYEPEQRKQNFGMVNNAFIDTIGVSARLHDIGNILMPDETFLDDYRSKEEQKKAFVKHHTEEGAKLLEELGANEGNRFLDMAVLICRYHHAKWDGSGYPENMSGEDIPLAARITAVANDFDALLRARYKSEPLSLEESVRIMNERSGKAYDSRIIEVFNKVVKQMRTD